ncbi:MAG TPA: hypothetical protein VJM83_03665 [Nitrospirota bacterium]|nr:hypothetical protein [Nitrospirota bacterium]
MTAVYALMIPAGLLGIGWGFWAAHNAKRPVDVIGSIVTIIGLVAALLGTLLVCVPGFFS